VGLAVITWLKNARAVVVKIDQTARYSSVVEQTGNCVSALDAETFPVLH